MSEIRVRFAPSPTGYLHIGNARSALFAWLFARANKGTFILRIEDTDRKRYVEGAEQVIYQSLRWLGLDWDEGPEVGGDYGPYVQSQRTALYRKAAEELIESGHAYRCYCSPERLAALREQQQRRKENSQYDRLCRNMTEEERTACEQAGNPSVIRLKTPLDGATTFHDQIRGDVTFENAGLDDLVLLKSDGYPTYHLANVVDDHRMKISHVLRADEWISSTPRHVLLYRAFGWEPPQFVHLPMILSPDGGKLSKRRGAVSVLEYRDRGYLPEAVFNFLALLGWSPGDDREMMSAEEIVSAFSLDRMSPKGAAFDETKLEWLNGQYIHGFSTEELLDQIASLWREAGFIEGNETGAERERLLSILALLKERSRRLTDFVEGARYFFEDPLEYEEKGRRKHWKKPDVGERLNALKGRLEVLGPFDEEHLETAVRGLAEERDISAAKLIHPARLAISGHSFGPGFFEMMEVLGKEAVVRRLDRAMGVLIS